MSQQTKQTLALIVDTVGIMFATGVRKLTRGIAQRISMIAKTEVESGIVKSSIANSILTKFTRGIFVLLKLLFCLFITMFVGYFAILVIAGGVDWQIVLYGIISMLAIASVWITAFAKVKDRTVVACALIFVLWFVCLCILPSVKKQIDMDGCIDAGDCKSLQITSEIIS